MVTSLTFALLLGAYVLTNRRGLTVTPDSINYVATARSFAQHGTLNTYTGLPLTEFPPGLPLVLGLLLRVGIPLMGAALAINALSLAVVFFCMYQLLRLANVRFALAWFVATLSVLTPTVWSTFGYLWSEPLFTAALLLFLLILARACKNQKFTRSSLALVILLADATFAFRYIGIIVFPVLFLGACMVWRERGRRFAWTRASLVTVAALLVPSLVVLRNVAAGAGPLGPRSVSSIRLGVAITQAKEALSQALATGKLTSSDLSNVIFSDRAEALLVAVLLGSCALALWRSVRAHHHALTLCVVVVVLYWAALLYGEVSTTLDPIDARLIEPVMPLMILVVAYALRPSHHRCSRTVSLLAALFATALFTNALYTISQGFFSTPVTANHSYEPFVRALAAVPKNAGIVSFDGGSLYWVTQHVPSITLGQENYYCNETCVRQSETELSADVARGTVHFGVFFPTLPSPLLRQLAIKDHIHFVTYRHFAGGTLYKLTPITQKQS